MQILSVHVWGLTDDIIVLLPDILRLQEHITEELNEATDRLRSTQKKVVPAKEQDQGNDDHLETFSETQVAKIRKSLHSIDIQTVQTRQK